MHLSSQVSGGKYADICAQGAGSPEAAVTGVRTNSHNLEHNAVPLCGLLS